MSGVEAPGGAVHDPWSRPFPKPCAQRLIGGDARPTLGRAANPGHGRLPGLIKMLPLWEHFQKRTQREFPVVILSPRAES